MAEQQLNSLDEFAEHPRQTDDFLVGARRAVESLADGLEELERVAPERQVYGAVADRGHFRPDEEEILLTWFARFLTIRSSLWEVLGDVSRPLEGDVGRILDTIQWRCFVLGYTSACLFVRLDRLLLEEIACDSVIQRKLNEGSVLHRIPRKQFTAVFESFTSPQKARMMDQAMRFAHRHRELLNSMKEDPIVGTLVRNLESRETVLEPSRRRYLARLAAYLGHTFRRRGASARQQAIFAAMETSGRLVSELHDRWTPCRVDQGLFDRLEALLQPGDVLITRHDRAFSNLFLPGYWPHAALYIGYEADRNRLGIKLDDERAARWSGNRRVLEALKDGVLFRPLEQTLAVDAVAVIRPQLNQADLAKGLTRVAKHEGELYNFDFDFFRSDRLVCTEVVYRAFDGLGSIRIPLQERSGRPTLSAEDLLDLAIGDNGFDPIAVCGTPSCSDRLIEGPDAREVIRQTYRTDSASE